MLWSKWLLQNDFCWDSNVTYWSLGTQMWLCMSITCCDKSCLLDRRPIYADVGCWNLKPCMDCSGLTPSFPIVKFLLLAKATMYSGYSKNCGSGGLLWCHPGGWGWKRKIPSTVANTHFVSELKVFVLNFWIQQRLWGTLTIGSQALWKKKKIIDVS